AFIFVFFSTSFASDSLFVYAGSASLPPLKKIVELFTKKNGIQVDLNAGGSGHLLSQMTLSKRGDVYFPGSSDYMEKAKSGGQVYPESEKIVAYLVSAINVPRGNPKEIMELKDLLRPGLKVAIGNPEGVCVGAYAVEIVENTFSKKMKRQFRKNLLNYTGSCIKTATAISLNLVDAVIGWRIFEHWDEKRIETIPLKPSEIVRLGYLPAAVSRYTKNYGAAEKFIRFMFSEEAQRVFQRYRYFLTPQEAFRWIGEKKKIGGVYTIPREWLGP
ncbi:MAG: molybdate ABC transporter substrate-binding protein, partial [Nitrospinota bacterium]